MINATQLTGRLTQDPELRYTPQGVPVASFSIAVERPFKNTTTGERETDFFDIVAWRKTAELVANYCKKGKLIGVEGRLAQNKYETSDGVKHSRFEVVADRVHFLEKMSDGSGTPVKVGAPSDADDDLPDDLPF